MAGLKGAVFETQRRIDEAERQRETLLQEQRRLRLNRKDPLGAGFDFGELDAMAETLFSTI